MIPRFRLALALLLPFAACGLQWLLWDEWIKPYVWFLFFPVAFFSAWVGGLAGGIGGTLISALLVWYLFIPPAFSFALPNAASVFSIIVFIVMGSVFSWFHEKLRRALVSSEGRFHAVFEQAAVGIGMMTPEGQILGANPKFCAITGRSVEELTAKSFKDITHPADLEANVAYLRRTLAGEVDHFTMEKRFIRGNGDPVWVNVTVSLVRKADGVPDYFIAVIEDISVRMLAEQRFRQLFEQAPVALSTSDRDGNILLMNSAFVDLFGYSPGEIRTVAEWRTRVLANIGQRASAEVDWRCKWQTGQVAELLEHEVVCSDGSRKTVLLSRTRLGEEMMLAAIDITDRKSAQELLLARNEELERFNRVTVGRELQMIRLKRQVNEMAQTLGRSPPYDLSFADGMPPGNMP